MIYLEIVCMQAYMDKVNICLVFGIIITYLLPKITEIPYFVLHI